ncbi:AAA family ATPase [Bradyrhizobium sp. GCM10023182]|uniref:Helicase RepA family protein n=1 Tax=Bradyrhizobium zhengyangense TaxID=2911009 RepID=A0ABS9LGB1_9BRAD|nr:AAA family ATPase [Bradyrhizobium zhengyangense]MCG2665888.1 helicase RepA family protein [Bradyrhizobium zhengyangense]
MTDQFPCPIPPLDPKDPFPDTWPGAKPPEQQERDERRDRLSSLKIPHRAALRLEPLESIFLEDDCAKAHIIKGIFAWGETSAWIAPPGGMKSALLASAAMSIALNQPWFGRRPPGNPVGVVYFALERADLVKRRLIAHRQKLGIPESQPIPVVVHPGMLDMMNPATVPLVVEAVQRAEDYFIRLSDCNCAGLLIFDTFAKMIAAGGGDENSAKDQGKVFANLQRIKDALGNPHVALIGHTGKDEARGARGSNALYGDVDVLVTICGDTIKTATVDKANDIPDGPLFSFASEIVEFGTDDDGDPITVNIVSGDEVSEVRTSSSEPKLSTNQRVMYRLLSDAGPTGLTVEAWNELAKEQGIATKQRHYEARMALKDKGLVREYAGTWRVNG